MDEESDFHGNANIEQDRTKLSSGFIKIDWRSNMLQALPFFDHDTAHKPIPPVIKEEGRDPMTGDEMTYNLKTKKGKIKKGKSHQGKHGDSKSKSEGGATQKIYSYRF